MRNKLRRKNNAELTEFESREFTPSAAGLHVGPAGSNQPAPRKGSETSCKEHQDQGELDGLLTRPVGHQSEGFQSFQGKRLSPERVLKQRCEASSPACTSLSVSSQQHCLEEIKKSNPAFPARRVFRFLQKKSSEKEGHLSSSGDKRKRQNEVNVPGKESKRQRQTVLAEWCSGRPPETVLARSTEAVRGHSRLSRTQRLKHLRQAGGSWATPPPTQKTESETESTSHDCPTTDAGIDDILWTERYSPWHSSEVIGNSSSVNKVHSWLKKWRRRVDGCARSEDVERKCPQNDNGLWDGGDFQGEAGSEGEKVEQLPNTLLLSGPPGVGKTASVYACAMELGFKVFEVNSSSLRSGRCVLAQLKEVTQSHLVEAPGKEALRPAYYNNYNSHNSSKPDVLPGKSSSERPASKQDPGFHRGRSRRRGTVRGPSAATLARFFGRVAGGPAAATSPPPETRLEAQPLATRPAEPRGRDKRTAAAMSLILFEEVDVIFEEDVGFLSAIRTLITMTKRPVVLTTSDPSFKERFERDVEEICFRTPSLVNVCSYLRLVCLAENAWTGQREVAGLLAECQGDIRHCLLQLHFLVKSGASRGPQQKGPHQTGPHQTGPPPRQCVVGGAGRPEDGEETVQCVPQPADTTGCPVSVSCLNTLTKQNILHLLKCQTWVESEHELLTVLTESWRRRFPLLYSNLEMLLPLPASSQGTTNCCPAKDPDTGMHAEQPPPASQPPVQQQQQQQQQRQPGEIVDLKSDSTTAMRTSVGSGSRLSRRKSLSTVTDLGRSSPHSALEPPATEGQPQSLESPQGSEDEIRDKEVEAQTHRALEALAHFADLMSYLDSTVATVEPHVSGPCVSRDFVWTGAEVRDGLVDEMRGAEGERTWRQQERLLEIQAAAEGLGFLVCRGWMSAGSRGTPTRSQQDVRTTERGEDRPLSLPESAGRLSSVWPLLPQPSAARRRLELSRTVLQNRRIGLLGSRRAVCLDYMPALRSICRHHHHHHSVQLGLSKTTMQLLAEEYME